MLLIVRRREFCLPLLNNEEYFKYLWMIRVEGRSAQGEGRRVEEFNISTFFKSHPYIKRYQNNIAIKE